MTYNVLSETLILYTTTTVLMLHKSSPGDEIPERDVTYHLICLLYLLYA